jgi:hypothetical protein
VTPLGLYPSNVQGLESPFLAIDTWRQLPYDAARQVDLGVYEDINQIRAKLTHITILMRD